MRSKLIPHGSRWFLEGFVTSIRRYDTESSGEVDLRSK